MLFTNINLQSKEREMEWGVLQQVSLGESGRGRKEIRLACSCETKLLRGLNMEYTIGFTKSLKPRINYQKDATLYLIISTEGGYTRRGNGWIGSWKDNQNKYTVLAKGNGADGDAGRIGQWDVAVIRVDGTSENDWIRIRTSGGGYGTDPQWLSISSKGIFLFDSTQDAENFADYSDLEFPHIMENVTEEFKDMCHA